MAALAEVVEGLAREMRLLDSHGFDHNANAAKQCVALLGDLNAELTFDDNREFDEIPGGYTAVRGAADGLDIESGSEHRRASIVNQELQEAPMTGSSRSRTASAA